MPTKFDCEEEPNEFMEMPCKCDCGMWFDLEDGYHDPEGSNKIVCANCVESNQQYYIISLKHTSKGDTALTFWGANHTGYVWNKERAGLYTESDAKKSTSDDNVMVEKEKVDPFWMNAVDFEDKYVSVPNNPTVRHHLGLNDKFMKPKKFASCRMVFTNTPIKKIDNK